MVDQPLLKVALIGYGAIGQEVFARAAKLPGLRITQVLVRPPRADALQARLGRRTSVITSVAALADDTDMVLEVAGHGALSTHGQQVLARGIGLSVVSVGALADDALRDALIRAARGSGARLDILPGAIGGIDALAAAGPKGLDSVVYVGRKPPMAWLGSPAEDRTDLAALTEETVIFDGSAREAAQLYPKNANVVATVALAGIGFDATQVTLVADPQADGNSHRIVAEGPLLSVDYSTQGKTLPSNPKTSALTALSALRALRNRAGPVSL